MRLTLTGRLPGMMLEAASAWLSINGRRGRPPHRTDRTYRWKTLYGKLTSPMLAVLTCRCRCLQGEHLEMAKVLRS